MLKAATQSGSGALSNTWSQHNRLLHLVLTAWVCVRRDLNLEGRHIDLCMNSGKDCGQKAAQAVCEYLGFDGAVTDQWSSAVADAPARSMTGAPALSVPTQCFAFCAAA